MEDFQGKYNGKQIDQLLDKANDIDLIKNRLIGVNTVTTLANLPISKRSITATLSAATTLSVQSGMQVGEELMIRCVPSAVFTQAIPNSGAYVSMSGTSITTTANKPFEINIWCYASGKYSIAVKEQD